MLLGGLGGCVRREGSSTRAILLKTGARSGAADRGRLLDLFDAPDLRKRDGVENGGVANPSKIDRVFGPDNSSGLPQAGGGRVGHVFL